jgi:hypothetical protein
MAAVVPYALSVHGFIDKVGADAGFAAIIGVALVVIMLFVHARETASLRTRAEDAEDRVESLERAVEQLGRVANQAAQLAQAAHTQSGHPRPGVAAAPAAVRTATAARPVPAPAVAAAYAGAAAQPRTIGPPPQLPAAPFMTAGPALSSATRLLPEPGAASSNGHVNGSSAAVAAPPAVTPPAPAPSTAAAGAPTPMPQIPSLPRPSDPRGDTEPPRSRPADTGSRAPRRNYGHAAETTSSRRRVIPVLIALLLVAVIAVAAVLVLNHHHSKGNRRPAAVTHSLSSTTSSKTTSGKKHQHTVTIDPRTVTVAVMNGTTTPNLAADISQKLAGAGFKQGKTTNFNTQALTTTTIGYASGHRPQALAVAKALKVKYSNVKQVTAATQALVCTAGTACPDQVFVVLGTDLASNA